MFPEPVRRPSGAAAGEGAALVVPLGVGSAGLTAGGACEQPNNASAIAPTPTQVRGCRAGTAEAPREGAVTKKA